MRAQTKTLYQYAKNNNLPLLGSNNFDFWAPYLAAYNVYDRYFKDRFSSWFYWINVEDGTSTESIYNDFIEAVQAHITINQKRYSELFRVQVLADSAYDIVNNYDLTETHSTTRSGSGTNVYGAREDSASRTIVDGAREDSASRTIVDGAREDNTSGSATDGARTDTASTAVGAQTNTDERQRYAFNSTEYKNSNLSTINNGSHTDTSTVNKGAQTNTTDSTINKGAQTNTDNSTANKGAQTNTDSSTANKGAQTDTHTDSGTESSNIRRFGNIGVQTAAEIIGGHINLWDSFNFYKLVFDEIAKDFLLLDNDYYEAGGVATGTDESAILSKLAEIESKIDNTAKSSELADLAKSSELADLAKSSELADLAKSSELADLAKSSELADLATTADLADLADSADINDIRGDILDAKADIVESIEGVSTNEY